MKNPQNYVVVLSAVVLVCCGALILGQKVNAAGEGKITGTVKLDGAAPHMKGIDMSKDPYCVKAHASDPAHLETYVVGASGGLENVVLYIDGWSGPATGNNRSPGIRSKELHVYAARVGHGRRRDIQGGHQRSDHPQHSPAAQPDDQYRVESVAAAGSARRSRRAGRLRKLFPVQCNIHPWMHGWFVVVKGPYATTDANGKYTINGVPPGSYTVTAWQEAAGTHDAESHGRRWRIGNRRFHLQGEVGRGTQATACCIIHTNRRS